MARKNVKTKKTVQKSIKKICNRCGKENSPSAMECSSCSSTNFAPSWVRAKRPINRQVAVEITSSNPEFGTTEDRITLTKWWPGGASTFHISKAGQWDEIERIVNEDLGPMLGWKTKKELIATVRKRKESEKRVKGDIRNLIKEYPDFLKQVAESIDPGKLEKEDVDGLVEILGNLCDAVSGADTGFRRAFLAVVKRLPAQPKRALDDLEALLSSWSLRQIASVAQQVKSRIETMELFKRQIQDKRTYEIRGANSIHRILERAMWLVDERYWLLQSNQSLLKFIGDEMAKKDKKKFGKKRPDFACGMVGERLIIIEIKRPARTMTIDDLNQLETYFTIAEQYKSYNSYEGYLIGNKKDEDLMRRLKHRSRRFKVWTYSDLLDSTEKRYRNYLDAIK